MASQEAILDPVGGGDPIPLERDTLTIGRRESCDICLKFPNISSLHCELSVRNGYWYIKDKGSTNGIKVNGNRVVNRPLRPGDEIGIGTRKFKIDYDLSEEASTLLEAALDDTEDHLGTSLLEKAGLMKTASRDDD